MEYFAQTATATIVTGTDANSCVNTDTMTIIYVNSLPWLVLEAMLQYVHLILRP